MIVLLGISTALAILIREPRQDDLPSGTGKAPVESTGPAESAPKREQQEAAVTPAPGPGGERPDPEPGVEGTVEVVVDAGEPLKRIAVEPGDRIVLVVKSDRPAVISVTGAGLLDTTGPYDPARFDLLVRKPAERWIVEDLDTGRNLARIEVR